MKKNIFGFVYIFIFLLASCAHHQDQVPNTATGPARVNSQNAQNAPYVLLISIDGYRHDYTAKYSPKHIKDFFEQGVRAKSLIPSFPSKTFPNHYTIVTGLYPENHGIVANSFYDFQRAPNDNTYKLSLKSAVTDGTWYQGLPLWSAAEQEGMLSGIYFWPGSEAKIADRTPTYFKSYDGKIANDERVETVLNWLNLAPEIRPHLLTLYFSDVDSAGHNFGTDSPELNEALQKIDQSLGKLFDGLKKLSFGVNVILVSDHGMQDLDENKIFYLDDYTDLSQFQLGDLGPLVSLYSPDQNIDLIQKTYKNLLAKSKGKNFKVHLRKDVPLKLHFSKNPRIGDIVVIADAPYSLGVHDSRFKMIKGSHGYDPQKFQTMQGIFYAKGPNIKGDREISSFQNIHIYPFVLKILGLQMKNKVDGREEVLSPLYRKN